MNRNKPDRQVILNEMREAYGLTLSELMEIVKIPTHPSTMRDDFALAALQGIVSNPETGCNSPKDFAYFAYQCADAMMKERIKNANANDGQ